MDRYVQSFPRKRELSGARRSRSSVIQESRTTTWIPAVPGTTKKAGLTARAGVAVLFALASGTIPALAQDPTAAVSPLLPPDHWSVRAAARAEALGLAPEYLPAQAAVPRAAVGAALSEAAERSDPLAGTTLGWWLRFQEEFPESREAAGADGIHLLGSHVGAGFEAARGRASPGLHEFPPERTGATPLPDRTEPLVRGELAAGLGSHVAAAVTAMAGTERVRIERIEAVTGWRSLRASVGRAEVGWGTGAGGGVIFSGSVPLDRLELSTSWPVRLPGFLGLLGPFAFQALGGPLPGDRHPGTPWLIGVTASARPHPRVTLSGHRAVMLGGDGVEERLGIDDVLLGAIGKNIPGANQIASTSLRLRLPTEDLLPLSIYCEWGAEDSAGAPFGSPGLVCGGVSPSLPIAPAVSLGLEHAQFGARPENGPPWYRHHRFPGNWAMDEAPLGHPLGGEGRQWLVYSGLSALSGRMDLDARAFSRRRTGENLYLPGRSGESTGFTGAADWRVHPRADLRLAVSREMGEGWSETTLVAMSRLLF